MIQCLGIILSMIPSFVKPFLWSYDTSRIDLDIDKKRIVINVLNLGTKKATDWLFQEYGKSEIKNILRSSKAGEWNKKSLNFWQKVLN